MRQRPLRSRGFTLAEVLVAMVLTGMVVAGVLRALSAQKKFYARQARILDARHALRASTTILGSELRDLSAKDGDVYVIASDSVAFRSTVAFGVVCGVDAASGRLALNRISGQFLMSGVGGVDSLLAFGEATERDDDDAWIPLSVSGIATSGLICASGAAPERVVTVGGSVANVWVGSPARLFRPYVYGLTDGGDGRWWLSRRLRSSPDNVPVAGPLAPPGDQGLVLTYFKSDGTGTTIPTEVTRVQISVRAPTYKSLADPDYRSLRTSVYLRSDG